VRLSRHRRTKNVLFYVSLCNNKNASGRYRGSEARPHGSVPLVSKQEMALRLRLARTAAEWTQEELGLALGFGESGARQQVGHLEAGGIPAAWIRLRDLVRLLPITADGLLRSDTEAHIGTAIFQARQTTGTTQAELGRLLGLGGAAGRQTVGKYEAGKVPSAWLRLRTASIALDVSADYLLGDGVRLPRRHVLPTTADGAA